VTEYACELVLSDTESCVVCPAVAAVPGVPESIDVNRLLGWNAGAYSLRAIAGNCYTQFRVPGGVVGVVVGLSPIPASNRPTDVPHGFYVYQAAGREWWRVLEAGVGVTAPVVRSATDDLFRMERRAGIVSYFHNDRRLYVSTVPQLAELHVVACLFSAGDGVT
jgi:hypothetical protein